MEPLQNGVRATTAEKLPVHPTSQMFWIFKLGKMTFGLGQTNIELQTAVCQANRKANILTTGRRIKDILRIIILMYS